MYSDFVKSFDSTDNIANDLMSFYFDGAEILSYADIIESVTFEDVTKLLKNAFDKEKITLSVVVPLNEKEEI
jgi:predicted Zn-dependent peptidase